MANPSSPSYSSGSPSPARDLEGLLEHEDTKARAAAGERQELHAWLVRSQLLFLKL